MVYVWYKVTFWLSCVFILTQCRKVIVRLRIHLKKTESSLLVTKWQRAMSVEKSWHDTLNKNALEWTQTATDFFYTKYYAPFHLKRIVVKEKWMISNCFVGLFEGILLLRCCSIPMMKLFCVHPSFRVFASNFVFSIFLLKTHKSIIKCL